MKQNDVEMVLQPSKETTKPTTAPTPPTGVGQSVANADRARRVGGMRKRVDINAKVFCAPRDLAMALLEDFIIMAGAHNEVMSGKVTDAQIGQISKNTQTFMIDLSDRLMIDCGLTEDDIKTIVTKLSQNQKQEQPL
jgi:hypothetical protein